MIAELITTQGALPKAGIVKSRDFVTSLEFACRQ